MINITQTYSERKRDKTAYTLRTYLPRKFFKWSQRNTCYLCSVGNYICIWIYVICKHFALFLSLSLSKRNLKILRGKKVAIKNFISLLKRYGHISYIHTFFFQLLYY